jgi:hypothetical protein
MAGTVEDAKIASSAGLVHGIRKVVYCLIFWRVAAEAAVAFDLHKCWSAREKHPGSSAREKWND